MQVTTGEIINLKLTISSLVLLTNQCLGCVVFSTEKIKSINSFFRLPVVGSRPENGPERLFFCKQDFNSMNMGTYKVQGRNYHWGRRCLVWFSEREKRKNREREVKSSWELMFIVIQKPNSNKVFLSYLILEHMGIGNI
jgi:hypothetical protein